MNGPSPSQPVRGDGLPLSVGDTPSAPRTSGEALMAALSYISFLGVIPLLLGQKSPYCRAHAKQGLTYNIVYFVAHVVASGFALIFSGLSDLPVVLVILHVGISVVCIAMTLGGRTFALPGIVKLSQEFPF